MRGSNELYLNGKTVIDALQEYLDRRTIRTKQRVTGVSQYGTTDRFKVEVVEEVDEEGDDGGD